MQCPNYAVSIARVGLTDACMHTVTAAKFDALRWGIAPAACQTILATEEIRLAATCLPLLHSEGQQPFLDHSF